ncbi:MCM DNA helicase complex subunit mcm6, partial [Coemansia aciculifera]
LESLIRLSEALARAHCAEVVTTRHVREAVRLLRRSIVHVEMDDIEVYPEEEEEDEETGVAAGAAGEATEARKLTVRREDFDRVRSMLVLRLRDDANESAEDESEGLRQDDLFDWYLAQREDAMQSEDDFAHEQRLVKTVLKYLISVEGCVIALRATNDEGEEGSAAVPVPVPVPENQAHPRGPLLMLHPNFSIE